jgi:Microtubule-binding protein MIP-T3 C-terminal region
VNPLGKILDFVQEDFDAMQKELEVWRRENHENVIALQREQRFVLLWPCRFYGLLLIDSI